MRLLVNEILRYGFLGFLGILVLAIIFLPTFFLFRKKASTSRIIVCFLFFACLVVICFVTFLEPVIRNFLSGRSMIAYEHNMNLVPFRFMDGYGFLLARRQVKQAIANVCMFIPISFLTALAFPIMRNFFFTVLSMFTFSFGIEFIQYFIGRAADIDDLMMNTIGAIIGYLIFALIFAVFGRTQGWKRMSGE